MEKVIIWMANIKDDASICDSMTSLRIFQIT
uniref:Uncharacterized protein n=1 Tax=Lepeophtheirus salmonis TaxID=72036 RepID=A0A0K2TLV5_LEPSM